MSQPDALAAHIDSHTQTGKTKASTLKACRHNDSFGKVCCPGSSVRCVMVVQTCHELFWGVRAGIKNCQHINVSNQTISICIGYLCKCIYIHMKTCIRICILRLCICMCICIHILFTICHAELRPNMQGFLLKWIFGADTCSLSLRPRRHLYIQVRNGPKCVCYCLLSQLSPPSACRRM